MEEGSDDGFTRGVLGTSRRKRAADAAETRGARASIERIVKVCNLVVVLATYAECLVAGTTTDALWVGDR